ncbi:hypothetical protein GF312_13700, partial [Candidatus Poribacteria bacterium]|nr:hypothetical protein [Candidatus Poribacteria bacterium]
MENAMDIIGQQSENALRMLNIDESAIIEKIAQSVLLQNAYWEQALHDGDRLLFIRYFSPVVNREEVFLGSVLFNDFLSKIFTQAVEESTQAQAQIIAS